LLRQKIFVVVSPSVIKATFVDKMGTDLTVVNAARVSFGKSSDSFTVKDAKLVKYLAEHEHLSPFEHCALTVLVECPLYVRSQIHRHRTFAYNEISRRYTSENIEFYLPSLDDIRAQATSNRQASEGVVDKAAIAYDIFRQAHGVALDFYNNLLAIGVCREQARGALPQNLMTKFYMTGNLRNWAHFVSLRLDKHAQSEVRSVAADVRKIMQDEFPVISSALIKEAAE
jgi:thymidylate synthase (FAD)